MGKKRRKTYAACIPPPAHLFIELLGRIPFPRPIKCDRGAAAGRVVADKLDAGILVEVWVRMKLSRDQVVDFFWGRAVYERKTIDLGVERRRRRGRSVGRWRKVLRLSHDKREDKLELIVVRKFDQETRRGCAESGWFWVLCEGRVSETSTVTKVRCSKDTHLDKFDGRMLAQRAGCRDSRRRKCIWGYRDGGALFGVGNGKRSDAD